MTDNTALIPSNAVEISGARTFTTSLMVAEVFGKLHKNVLQSIDELDCSAEFRRLNFQPSERQVVTGSNFGPRQERFFEITKNGFVFLVMGYTGAKAAQFKEAYIARFDAMEAQLQGTSSPIAPGQRWLANVDYNGNLIFNPVDPQAFLLPACDWPKVIKTPDFPRALLPDVLAAVGERMKGLPSGGVASSPQPTSLNMDLVREAVLRHLKKAGSRGLTVRDLSRKIASYNA